MRCVTPVAAGVYCMLFFVKRGEGGGLVLMMVEMLFSYFLDIE
jgi:hypothetical protein